MLDMIRNVLVEYVDVPKESITEATDFIQDLHMNSYDFVSLIGQLEETLGIETADDELADLHTVGDVLAYLKSKIQ